MAIAQSVLAWTLLGFLLMWMVTFAVLAILPLTREKVPAEDYPTPSHSFPVVAAPTILRVIASQPLQSHVGVMRSEPPGDLGTTPVA